VAEETKQPAKRVPRAKKETPAPAPAVAAAPDAVAPRDENIQDSLGQTKDTSVTLGPHGDESVVHIPAGFKPEPENQKPTAITTSDEVDSANKEVPGMHVPGPRGENAHHSKDSYRL
jgi:hypothetical protein